MKTFKFSLVAVAFALMVGLFGGTTPAMADRGDSYNGRNTYGYGHGYRYGHRSYRRHNRRSYYYSPYRSHRRSYRRHNRRNFYFNFGGHGFGFRYGY